MRSAFRAQGPLVFLLAMLSTALCAAPAGTASEAPASPGAQIALLLPLDSPDYAAAANAVRLGCDAARTQAHSRAEVVILRTDGRAETILSSYSTGLQLGARVMVGPLTRSGVAALASSDLSGVPTLALNVPEGAPPLPEWLYTFGLSIEGEARSVARAARQDNLRNAVVVMADTPLAARTGQAFAAEWLALGGSVALAETIGPAEEMERMRRRLARTHADVVFVAANAGQARAVRPYLNRNVPVYGTSQLHDGAGDPLANLDLNGILFVDMPWLVQPYAESLPYPRPESLGTELQRFYALGIDACRIALRLEGRPGAMEMEGATGRITLEPQRSFRREPVLATLRDGAAVAAGAPR